jgi:cysteine desulfurase
LDVEGESIVQALDMEHIAASSGAACDQGDLEPSPVLEAMGFSPDWGVGSLRLTLGRSNDGEDVSRVLEVLPRIINRLRG